MRASGRPVRAVSTWLGSDKASVATGMRPRLTLNTQSKVLAALNRATGKTYMLRDLFTY